MSFPPPDVCGAAPRMLSSTCVNGTTVRFSQLIFGWCCNPICNFLFISPQHHVLQRRQAAATFTRAPMKRSQPCFCPQHLVSRLSLPRLALQVAAAPAALPSRPRPHTRRPLRHRCARPCRRKWCRPFGLPRGPICLWRLRHAAGAAAVAGTARSAGHIALCAGVRRQQQLGGRGVFLLAVHTLASLTML